MTKAQLKRRLKKYLAVFTRIGLKNRDFSIISNNCWGGVIYDKYALPYNTPTIGLWIPPKDYLKFLSDLEFYKEQDLVQINYTDSHVADLLIERKRNGRYDFDLADLIIGRLYDIDIVFIHYNSFQSAKDKWNRRIKRINYDNLLVKMNDQNGCTEEDYKAFLRLPYKNKIFITANENWKDGPGVIFLEKYKQYGYVLNDTSHGDVPINTTKLLNSIME